MHPTFEQFVASLGEPALRPGIGLSISDDDAAALLTNADWARDYYARWIALFPPVAAPPVAAAPTAPEPAFATPEPALATPEPALAAPGPWTAPAASAAASSPFGPPPTGAPRQAYPAALADAQPWAVTPRRRLSSPVRIAIIAAATVVALGIVASVVNEVRVLSTTPVAASTRTPDASPPASSDPSPSPSAVDDPIVFHGLTQTEYDLIEAILAPQGHTLEQAVAQGTNDATIHQLATNTQASTAKTCTDGEALDNGFDNVTFRASFIAGYEATQKATPQQATAVYDALAAYCGAH